MYVNYIYVYIKKIFIGRFVWMLYYDFIVFDLRIEDNNCFFLGFFGWVWKKKLVLEVIVFIKNEVVFYWYKYWLDSFVIFVWGIFKVYDVK